MKVETIYTAFDGQTFRDEKACLEYEETTRAAYVEDLHKRMQVMKSGYLADEFNRYMRAKKAYSEACNKKCPRSEFLNKALNYLRVKESYHNTIVEYKKLQIKYRNIRQSQK